MGGIILSARSMWRPRGAARQNVWTNGHAMNDERFAIISYFEARKIVTAESEGRSSLGSRTCSCCCWPTRPSTSAAVQTDLTWPDRQEQPSLIRPPVAIGTDQSSQTASPSRSRTEHSSKSKQCLCCHRDHSTIFTSGIR